MSEFIHFLEICFQGIPATLTTVTEANRVVAGFRGGEQDVSSRVRQSAGQSKQGPP